jgi:hypothetical protein
LSRILDLSPTSEEVVVSRVLLSVHKAVDEHFPKAEQPSRQFSKTVFSEEALEGAGKLHLQADRKEGATCDVALLEPAPNDSLSPPVSRQPIKGSGGLERRTEFSEVESTDTGASSSQKSQLEANVAAARAARAVELRREESLALSHPVEADAAPPRPKKTNIPLPSAAPSSLSPMRSKRLAKNQPTNAAPVSQFETNDGTRLDDTFGLMQQQQLEPNWISRVTVAFLLAGVILFVYVLLW